MNLRFPERTNLTSFQDDITSIILAGGTTRVPMIQGAVKAIVGE